MTHEKRGESARGSQVMRNDVGVSTGIGQIIPEPSYIIQISFFCTPYPLSVITALSSGTLSLADSRFKQIWFLFLYVPVTSLLLREPCAGIGTRIKSPSIAKHDGKDGGRRESRAESTCIAYVKKRYSWCRCIILFLLFHPFVYFVFMYFFLSVPDYKPELLEKKGAEDVRRICQHYVDITYQTQTNSSCFAHSHKGELKKELAQARIDFRDASRWAEPLVSTMKRR